MKRLITVAFLFTGFFSGAQTVQRPKLVVGMVVDQMRWDYLYRFYDRLGTGGFRRLLGEGFSCENTYIQYTPTYTAAGHASIYSGSTPALNGIMGNNWYDRQQRKVVYCTDDTSVTTVGSNSVAGKMSPRNLWSSTITDELRLATNFRNKTIAVALKDRGAILPGGHSANAAYWFDNASGGWISSTFYMNALPEWVNKFNARKLPDSYMQQNWNTVYPIATYLQSTSDSNAYESRLGSEDNSFPHLTSTITNNKYEAFRTTPFGNTYTLEMAKAAIAAESLGKGSLTDFLAVSLSSTDYIGHSFGPNSIEVEDTYLRLDRDLAGFLSYLDATVGKGQYLLFLTADHGAAHNPSFMRDHRLPAGTIDETAVRRRLNDSLQAVFGSAGIIANSINYQLYLDDSIITRQGLNKTAIKQYIISTLIKQPGIARAIDLENLSATNVPAKLKQMIVNGFNQRLSGDIQLVFMPQYFENWRSGTTHGLWNPYDAHIPLVWFGWHVRAGHSNREVYMSDIAPTLAAMLHIQTPNAAIGNVIEEVAR